MMNCIYCDKRLTDRQTMFCGRPHKGRVSKWIERGIRDVRKAAQLLREHPTCMICGAEESHKRHSVDHDKDTGLTRGILCNRCNINYEWWLTHRESIENYGPHAVH